jgi:hypothetical protein
MPAQTTQEKLDKISKLWSTDDHYDAIYAWVKTGEISNSEFVQIVQLVSQLDEDESRKCWG